MNNKINDKDSPLIKQAVEESTICICTRNHESPVIEKKCLVEILTINNRNCPSLKEHDIVQVEGFIRKEEEIIELMLAGYPLKIPDDCTVRKVCSCCGKPIDL